MTITSRVDRARPFRLALRCGNLAVAVAVSACLLGLLGAGLAGVPALGPALVPGHGAWTSAAGARLPVSQTLDLPGLSRLATARPVQVTYTSQGLAAIAAPTDNDAYLALGYVEASFRLTEMDIERRLAEGKLAQLAGSGAVGSDKFELRLGLLRTARQEWAELPKSGAPARALAAFARGVNDYLAQLHANGRWPAVFSLARVYPASWTPVDSLAIQGGLTQALGFTTTPLVYELLERSLGAQQTTDWFGVLPPGQQAPYDPGPYANRGLAPEQGLVTVDAVGRAPVAGPQVAGPQVAGPQLAGPQLAGPPVAGAAGVVTASIQTTASDQPQPGSAAGLAQASTAILSAVAALPAGQVYTAPASNAWAANGPRVAGGGAMLAGDPHLTQTLPSVWYQVALAAPGLSVSGVTIPGLPAVLIGHNAHIAWSLTDVQSQSAFFYAEQTSKSRPGEYFWDGHWRRMQVLHYSIPVRGGATRRLTVDATVHGPVMTQDGQTVSVDWIGALGSPDLADMQAVEEATDYAQFRAALATWRSPALNFVYADDRGNIGAIAAGYYPQVRHGQPWLPMGGTGADDVAGVIPYQAVPQVYDPPSHVIASANQRPVGDSYPYYLGTTADFFDPGYRAEAEYGFLQAHRSMTQADFAALQTNVTDPLAAEIVPKLLAALQTTGRATPLTALQQQAERNLASWDDQMTASSTGASVWWTFWTDYLSAVFQPWWRAAKVPVHLDRGGLSVGPDQFSLDADLTTWTLSDQQDAAFSPPGDPPRDAATVMRAAFNTAVAHLAATLPGGPSSWAWGKLHTRQFPSLTGTAALGYGPRAAGGDFWTVDAAEGAVHAEIGPSFRMIVSWSGSGTPVAQSIYPGGQSENPGSPWYSNLVADWWAGKYLPMPQAPAADSGAAAVSASPGTIRWELRP
ncbi:MAG TPA: penicillin acylase family protein [Streptosporangiaceae bacterium]|jgi:penicillin amidase